MLFSKETHQDFDMNGVFLHKRWNKRILNKTKKASNVKTRKLELFFRLVPFPPSFLWFRVVFKKLHMSYWEKKWCFNYYLTQYILTVFVIESLTLQMMCVIKMRKRAKIYKDSYSYFDNHLSNICIIRI